MPVIGVDDALDPLPDECAGLLIDLDLRGVGHLFDKHDDAHGYITPSSLNPVTSPSE